MTPTDQKKSQATDWFRTLRDQLCAEFEKIETEYETARGSSSRVASHGEPRSGGGQERSDAGAKAPSINKFTITPWTKDDHGGGGEMGLMKGRVFEKVGVNISTVQGEFSEQFRKEIPGAATNPRYWAAGISLVAHMANPHVPAAHFNTRMIVVGHNPSAAEGGCVASHGEPEPKANEGERSGGGTPPAAKLPTRLWFGGGGDLNPMFPNPTDTADFHAAFKQACDAADEARRARAAMSPRSGAQQSPGGDLAEQTQDFYPAFKAWCDEYFFLPHRNEARGVGGIFYDYLGLNQFGADTTQVTPGQFGKGGVGKEATSNGMTIAANANLDWDGGFAFTQSVGRAFASIYPQLIRRHMHEPWTDAERHHQLVRRGRYAEYNLLYDRGTRFGLMTGGNPDAILMSLPPLAIWE